ncbi:Dehydroquinate synthase-like protein [Sporormia fimetaria CBS 119925]|uniref:Dehydroquinate synthase-like protein n=1 Tax=Sporormia fimetaria CBS 119925 TaxID=1340428 RepID=A0A6A6VAQ2_9PLEO|nr:Dehydroquinate synthase-like protein [Sporormia fimetaria CBS 119925]
MNNILRNAFTKQLGIPQLPVRVLDPQLPADTGFTRLSANSRLNGFVQRYNHYSALNAAQYIRLPQRRCLTYPPLFHCTYHSPSSHNYSTMTESTISPLSGLWQPTHLQKLHYGPSTVQTHLLSCLPTDSSKAFIITGNSLAIKTPLIKQLESLLSTRHAGTFSKIGEHAPVADLDAATKLISEDGSVDTVISVGGGSPIDSAKAISYRLHEKTGNWLHHIAIPTTLSASECTMMAGYTESNGVKTGVRAPELVPSVVLYDSAFALHTPERLFLSTGMRAMDHAVELLYHGYASEMPAKWCALQAAGELYQGLREYKKNPKDEQTITRLQLAAFASLGFLGTNLKGGLGLSHSLGYALGSPYGIPHGITSCLTLGHVVVLKSEDGKAAGQVARLMPFLGEKRSGDDRKDARVVGEKILGLVKELGLEGDLGGYGVGRDQLHVIVKRATGAENGEVYERVKGLVEGLWKEEGKL